MKSNLPRRTRLLVLANRVTRMIRDLKLTDKESLEVMNNFRAPAKSRNAKRLIQLRKRREGLEAARETK